MTQTTQFTIGAKALCSDGEAGTMTRVVIDPVAETVTHLVVEPDHQHAAGRLVPLSLVRSADGELHLDCTVAELEKLDLAEETHFVPDDGGYAPYGPGQTFTWPYYRGMGGAGMWAGGAGMGMGAGVGIAGGDEVVTTDSVPSGEVAVYRGDRVHATDGGIGHVRGLVIDATTHHVTHVLLHEGHLFSRKDVAVPIGAVTRIGETIQLDITRQQVEDLPPVDFDQREQTP